MLTRLRQFTAGPIARATLGTSAVLALRLLAQIGTLLLVTRLLGPGSFGAFAGMAALAVTLGALSTFGTHLLLLREVSCAPDQTAQFKPVAVATTLLSATVLLGLYLLLTLIWLHPKGMSLLALLAIGLSDIMLIPLLMLVAVERQGQGQIARSQLLLVLPQALRLLAALLVFVWQPQDALTVYAAAYAAAAFISLPLGSLIVRHPWPHWRTWRLPNRRQWQETSGFAALNLTALGPNELDKTFALHLLPAAAAGSYAAASRVMGPLVLPVLAMMIAALPRLFREQTHTPSGKKLLKLSLWLALGYGLLAAVALWFFAPVIAWLFGEKFAGVTETLHWLALAVPGLTLRYVVSNTLMSLGETWLRVAVELTGLIILGIAAFEFATLGAAGMALALACSEWVMTFCGLVALSFPALRIRRKT
jgi:O-antigen/teichoic acid export membrane protein